MSYQISNICNLSVSGVKAIFTEPTGYSIYPITYKGTKYIVDIEAKVYRPMVDKPSFSEYVDASKVLAHIYPYREKPSIFFGKKGKSVYETDITILNMNEQELDLRRTKTDDLKIHLPEIMQIIFDRWEHNKQANAEKQAAVKAAEAWDGSVMVDIEQTGREAGATQSEVKGHGICEAIEVCTALENVLQNNYFDIRAIYGPGIKNIPDTWYCAIMFLFEPRNTFNLYFTIDEEGNAHIERIDHLPL